MDQQEQNNMKPISGPEQAIEQFLGEEFIDWLAAHVAHEVKNSPELGQVLRSQPKIERLRKLLLQRYVIAQAVWGSAGDPGFFGFAVANLSEANDPAAEVPLEILEQKQADEQNRKKEEDGWKKLLLAAGVAAEDIQRAEPKESIRNYIAELSDIYSNSEWQTALGAWAAYEWSQAAEDETIISLIKQQAQVPDSDMEVLSWHLNPDFKYSTLASKLLDKIVFDQEGKQLVWEGVRRHLAAKKDLYAFMAKYLEDRS